MYKNGVSHLTAQSDLDGALQIVQWLSFVPDRKGKAVPIFPSSDTWDRPISYLPPKGPYDPRWFIAGKMEEAEGEAKWLPGFFDKGSFQETLGGWAQTVVVGRARLGGIPMGVIAVESE
jgi:acetyl-CoA carboxylase / biotin carboxylase 1